MEENGRERRVLQGRRRRQAGNFLFLLLLFACVCVCLWRGLPLISPSLLLLLLLLPPSLPRSLTRSLAQGLHCCSWMKLIQVFIYSSLFYWHTRQLKEEEEEEKKTEQPLKKEKKKKKACGCCTSSLFYFIFYRRDVSPPLRQLAGVWVDVVLLVVLVTFPCRLQSLTACARECVCVRRREIGRASCRERV